MSWKSWKNENPIVNVLAISECFSFDKIKSFFNQYPFQRISSVFGPEDFLPRFHTSTVCGAEPCHRDCLEDPRRRRGRLRACLPGNPWRTSSRTGWTRRTGGRKWRRWKHRTSGKVSVDPVPAAGTQIRGEQMDKESIVGSCYNYVPCLSNPSFC